MTRSERLGHMRLAIANLAEAKFELEEAGFGFWAEDVRTVKEEVEAEYNMESL